MMEKPNILLVDDEERIIDALKLIFRREYKIFATTNPEQAIDILKNNKIHVLVSDQRMPEMQGVDLLRNAAQISPNTMRLLLTGYSDLDAIVDSINEGEIFRYISKPWVNEEIKEKVNAAANIAVNLDLDTTPKAKAATEKPSQHEVHVLLVDDDKHSINKLNKTLDAHCVLHHAETLDKAIEILEQKPIAVVVSELIINGENISSFIKILKQKYPNIISMVTTPFKDKDALIDLINQAQVFRFMPKPILETMLKRNLQNAINHYKAQLIKPELTQKHVVEEDKKGIANMPKNLMSRLLRLKK